MSVWNERKWRRTQNLVEVKTPVNEVLNAVFIKPLRVTGGKRLRLNQVAPIIVHVRPWLV